MLRHVESTYLPTLFIKDDLDNGMIFMNILHKTNRQVTKCSPIVAIHADDIK